MIRIFIAIDLPEDIKDSLSSIRAKLKGAKWTNREQMHLTLTFIGEVPEFKLKEIAEVLDQITCRPFKVKLQGVGHFKTKVFWLGVAPNEELNLLKEKVDEKLSKVGVEIKNKKYTPHITLARSKGTDSYLLAPLLEQFSMFESREFAVNDFKLFSSVLDPLGAIHSVESEFFLEG